VPLKSTESPFFRNFRDSFSVKSTVLARVLKMAYPGYFHTKIIPNLRFFTNTVCDPNFGQSVPIFQQKKLCKSVTLWEHLPKRFLDCNKTKKEKKWDTLGSYTLGSWTVIKILVFSSNYKKK